MNSFPKPVVLVCHSPGLLSERISTDHGFLARLSSVAFVRTVCPETELGLTAGTSLRLEMKPRAKHPRLLDAETREDLTDAMKRTRKGFVDSLGDADGFVMESRSATCALDDAAVFRPEAEEAFGTRPGFFSDLLFQKNSRTPALDDVGLADPATCHHFLTRIYTMARLRGVRLRGTADALARFHGDHEVLFLVYGSKAKQRLDQLSLAPTGRALPRAIQKYADEVAALLQSPPPLERGLDALYRAVEELAPSLNPSQRFHFLSLAERFAAGSISLGEVLPTVCQWIELFGGEALRRQAFFRPYPSQLLDTLDLSELLRGDAAA